MCPLIFTMPKEYISLLFADHLIEQIKAGASAAQLFDSWAGELAPREYEAFAFEVHACLFFFHVFARCLWTTPPPSV